MARADKFTIKTKIPVIYSDFTNDFALNPLSGALATVINEQSIIQSLKNLILTNKGEALYDINKGSKVRTQLFDLYDNTGSEAIKASIRETVRNYAPRVKLEDIDVIDDMNGNGITVNITCSCVNIPNQFNFNIILKRVR